MNETIDNTQNQDVIELGVASTDTHGIGTSGEDLGVPFIAGIAKE